MSSSSTSTPMVGRGLEANSMGMLSLRVRRRRRPLVTRPELEQAAEVRDEVFVLVLRERAPHRVDEDAVEVLALDPRYGHLVDVRQVLGTELPVPFDFKL